MTKEELLQEMRAGHKRLEALLERIPDGRVGEPALPNGWTVRDLLGHLTYWEQFAFDIYTQLKRGETPDHVGDRVDEINALVYTESQRRSFEDLRREEADTFHDLYALVAAAPPEALTDPNHFDWTGGYLLAEVISDNSSGHYEEHLPELEEWVRKI